MKHTAKAAALIVPLLMLSSVAFSATPDDKAEIAALKARLAADQAAAAKLERALLADETRAGPVQVADLFGPSEEEKAAAAAAAAHEQAQDANIASLGQRASDIEDSIRRLTGQIEVLNHRLDEMDQRIERVRKEFDYKICTMSAQQLGATADSGAPTLPCMPGSATAVAPAAPAPQPNDPAAPPPSSGVQHLAPPPGVLGTLPQGAQMPQPQPMQDQDASVTVGAPDLTTGAPAVTTGAPTQMASIDTHAQFESAMNMLARQQYDEARGAFRSFVDTYPKDPMAPEALYWLGDVAYVQKDYSGAVTAFAEELKKFPTTRRAPESMLKLGQSLLAMNRKQDGCTALHMLVTKYPSATKTVLNEAEAVRKAGGCHR